MTATFTTTAADYELVDAEGGPRMSGPQVLLVAIVRQIGEALTATQGD